MQEGRRHGDIRQPTLQKRVEPAYPAEAKAAGAKGPVYVEAIIGRDDHVRDARLRPLRVVDRTAIQVRELIEGALTDRQLAEGRPVTVGIYRTN